RLPVTIPADTPIGQLSISVGDGNAVQQNTAIQQFVPRDLSDMVRTINELKLPDRLYVQAFKTTTGAIIGASEMPNLPPSVMATLNNPRTAGGIKPAVQSIIAETRVPAAEFIITGHHTLTIEVVR
ncbi:MAG: hypothetical protein LC734_08215, partial [Acidobacteria bacterium]|nr:hypothetical protein [Acidobacteriota bacterium]